MRNNETTGIHSFGTWVTCIWRGISFGLYKSLEISYISNIKNISLDANFHAELNEHIFEYFTLENQMEKCNFLKNSRYFDYVEKISFSKSLISLKELKIF